jgi:hypothetical protein
VPPCGFTPHCGDCGEPDLTHSSNGSITCCDAPICEGASEAATYRNDQTQERTDMPGRSNDNGRCTEPRTFTLPPPPTPRA